MYLNCHSYYSLRYGTMSVEKLVSEVDWSRLLLDYYREQEIYGINWHRPEHARHFASRMIFPVELPCLPPAKEEVSAEFIFKSQPVQAAIKHAGMKKEDVMVKLQDYKREIV